MCFKMLLSYNIRNEILGDEEEEILFLLLYVLQSVHPPFQNNLNERSNLQEKKLFVTAVGLKNLIRVCSIKTNPNFSSSYSS